MSERLTVEAIEKRVQEIDAMSGDDEAAHSAEDKLHQAVLAQIADGCGEDARLARAALKTLEMDFARWCA